MAMSMRQRGETSTSRPRQFFRPIYEDFQAHFELKEEQEAHIIHLPLPGFQKEQVKITFVHATAVLRVNGQRPLGNNRWSRFNQTFPIQENCDVSKIHGKFHSGILTITLPKKQVITQEVGPKEAAAKPIQEAPSPSKSSTTTPGDQKKPQKVQEDVPSIASLTSTTVAEKEKDTRTSAWSAGPQKTTSADEPKAQNLQGQEGIPQTATHAFAAAAAQDQKLRQKAQDQKLREKISALFATPQEAAADSKAQNLKGGDEKERGDKKGLPLSPPEGINAEPKALKDKEKALPKVISEIQNEKPRDERRLIPLSSPQDTTSDHPLNSHRKGQDERRVIPLSNPQDTTSDHPLTSHQKGQDEKRADSSVQNVIQKGIENQDGSRANGKPAEPNKVEKVVKTTTLEKKKENGDQKSTALAALVERVGVPEIIEKGKKKMSKRFEQETKPKDEDSIAENVSQGMKNLVKMRMNDEDKQLLINMGAAVLVLMALGAYVTYTFWSSAKPKN